MVGLIKSYDGRGSFAGWVDSQLENRAKRVLDKTVKRQTASTDEFEARTGKKVDQAVEDAPVEIIAGTKAKRLTQRLGFEPKTAETINTKVKDVLVGSKLVAPTKAGYNKNVRDRARKALYPTVKAELGKDTKANPQFTKNLIKNWNKYLKLIPDVSLAQSRHETAGWVDSPPTQREFVDYFTGKGVESASARSNRREQLANLIAEGLFAESANEYLQDEDTTAKFALINEIENNPEAISQARIPFIERVAISESRINGLKTNGYLNRVDDSRDLATNFVNTLGKVWSNILPTKATTSRVQAISWLVDSGAFENRLEAQEYVEGVNGFAFETEDGTNYIYTEKSTNANTPIHEFGHIWNKYVKDLNPKLWEQASSSILQDEKIFQQQFNRVTGTYTWAQGYTEQQVRYYLENNVRDENIEKLFDEMMAGAIGDRGELWANNAEVEGLTKFEKVLDRIWEWLGKTLAFAKGKDFASLTADEMLDLVVKEVVEGSPGSAFSQIQGAPVGSAKFEAARKMQEIYLKEHAKPEQLREQAEYDAFTAMKDALSGGLTIEQAIDKGYAKVANHMSEAEFFKVVKKGLDQTNVDRAALQDSFDVSDQDPGTMAKIWDRLAGSKIEKLLEGRFDTQISKTVKGKKVKVDRAPGDTVEAKWARNREFFEKNKDLYVQHFPKQFWRMLSIGNKESILSIEDAEYFAENAPESSATWDHDDAFGQIKSLREESTYLVSGGIRKPGLKDYAKSKEYNKMVDDNQRVIIEFGDAIQALYQAGVSKGDLAKLTKSLTNTGVGRTNIFRKAPRLTGYASNVFTASEKVPEHNPPAGYIAQFIFENAIKGKFDNEAKNAIKEKFNYWLVGKDLDPGTKGSGFSNLRDGITKGFDFRTDNPFIRYIATGGNISLIKDVDGNSIAEQYGVSRSFIKDSITLNSKALQDAIVKSVVSTERPLRQQLVDDIDVLLGGLEVLKIQAEKRQAIQKILDAEKADEAAAEAVRQEILSSEEAARLAKQAKKSYADAQKRSKTKELYRALKDATYYDAFNVPPKGYKSWGVFVDKNPEEAYKQLIKKAEEAADKSIWKKFFRDVFAGGLPIQFAILGGLSSAGFDYSGVEGIAAGVGLGNLANLIIAATQLKTDFQKKGQQKAILEKYKIEKDKIKESINCLLYTSPSPRDS